MEVEGEGERLKKEKENRAIEFEKKVVDEKEQITKISQLALQQFLKQTDKDFQDFNKKLSSDLNKYKEKLKDEGVAYELKTKANLIAKEAERLLSNNSTRARSKSPSAQTSVSNMKRQILA